MKKLITFFLFCSLLSACERNLDPPQPTTTTKPAVHQDTIRCKVNGKDWEAIPKNLNGQFFSNAVTAELSIAPLLQGDTVFNIVAFQLDANKQPTETINFGFWIKDNSNKYTVINGSIYEGACANYQIDTNYQRPVIINYHDRKKGLIKGTFSFKGITNAIKPCKDTAIIADGYFSVRY